MWHLIPFNVLVNVYNSLVQPHIDYYILYIDYYYLMLWSTFIIALLKLTLIIIMWYVETVTRPLVSEKLQRLQNRATRILMSATYDSNLEDVFRALGWHKLCYQRLEKKSIMMTQEYTRLRFVYRDTTRALIV